MKNMIFKGEAGYAFYVDKKVLSPIAFMGYFF
jgi:hypothetical protein